MLTGVIDQREITKLISKLQRHLDNYVTFKGRKRILYPQGSEVREICYSKELGLWWHLGKTGNVKYYWNCFGLEDPTERKSLRIAVEINMPFSGRNFNISGLWAKDKNNEYYLLHDGGIGGGAVGVGKNLFRKMFTGEYEEANVDGRIREYAMVLKLSEPTMASQLVWFVNKVRAIKDSVKNEKVKSKNQAHKRKRHKYNPEFFGIKTYNLPEAITANCNHGIVVDELKKQLELMGLKCSNEDFIDLYTINEKGVSTNMFEIKSNLSRYSVYTAIGQLMLNSRSMVNKPKYFFVCPSEIDQTLEKDLKTLDIHVIKFRWEKGKPVFHKLKSIKY